VPRQTGPAEQLASRASLLLVNRDHRDAAEYVVHAAVCGTAAQDFSQSRRDSDDTATPPSNRFE
jgi:hypothetical protein